jgi:cardiolipin synthase
MDTRGMQGYLTWGLLFLLEVLVVGRILLRSHRDPSSRIAWITVVVAVPVVGIAAYLLLGETNLGRRQMARILECRKELPAASAVCNPDDHAIDTGPYTHLFQLGQSISGFTAVGGNSAALLADSNAAIDAIVADIDQAQHHVHLSFYIWLADNNGCKIIEALKRAARRGVECRALADGLGSRSLIKSHHWADMSNSAVRLGVALPLGNPLTRPLRGRIDLRNHRKIVVVDGDITYCGSQNCADPEFRVKAKFAPWVDILLRFTGPVARQNQYLFAGDWMLATDEDLSAMLQGPVDNPSPGFTAQVIGTGPTYRYSAMPELFISLLSAARSEITISTPYYVPNEAMQAALCTSGYRGVATTLILPARNDSRTVAATSRSYYAELLEAGVKILEFNGGLLHAKTLTVDGQLTLIGSANMDRRSFDLNFENNILVYDETMCTQVYCRQQEYIGSSTEVLSSQLENVSVARRLWNNSLAMLSPVL